MKISIYQIVSFILTILGLCTLAVDFFFTLPIETERIIQGFDVLLCVYFFIELIYKTIKELKEKTKEYSGLDFMIDFLACIPTIDAVRSLRLLRLIRIVKAYKQSKNVLGVLFANRAKGALLSMITIGVSLLLVSSISILLLETDVNSNIKTAEDAVWWSYCTITTVGYGDRFPVTFGGRLVGMALMTFGVAFFGVLTTYLSSIFVKKNS